jgi:hypothetical protein
MASSGLARWVVEFINERLGRDVPIGIFDDGSYLTPVNPVRPGSIEIHPEPPGEHSTRRGRWREEAHRLRAHHLLLHAGRNRTPQRDPTITVVIIVEVAQRSLITNKEARLAVTRPLVYLGKSERNPSHAIERSHRPCQLTGIASYSLTEPPLLSPGHPLAMTTAS